jgi:hypothetical protein
VSAPALDEPRLIALVQLIGRTGASEFQVRYCDEEVPLAWIAAARWEGEWHLAGAVTPYAAVMRLAESVMDGGRCRHCGMPTAVDDQPPDELLAATESIVCWYRYDPELETFRRSCEGVAP